jgi:hypothetical protein
MAILDGFTSMLEQCLSAAPHHRGNTEGRTAQTTARPRSNNTGIRGRELSTSKRTSTSPANRLASTYSARFIRGVYWGRRALAAWGNELRFVPLPSFSLSCSQGYNPIPCTRVAAGEPENQPQEDDEADSRGHFELKS